MFQFEVVAGVSGDPYRQTINQHIISFPCFSLKLWRAFVECFNNLPAAALVDEKIFCCHGGLSPELLKGEGTVFQFS